MSGYLARLSAQVGASVETPALAAMARREPSSFAGAAPLESDVVVPASDAPIVAATRLPSSAPTRAIDFTDRIDPTRSPPRMAPPDQSTLAPAPSISAARPAPASNDALQRPALPGLAGDRPAPRRGQAIQSSTPVTLEAPALPVSAPTHDHPAQRPSPIDQRGTATETLVSANLAGTARRTSPEPIARRAAPTAPFVEAAAAPAAALRLDPPWGSAGPAAHVHVSPRESGDLRIGTIALEVRIAPPAPAPPPAAPASPAQPVSAPRFSMQRHYVRWV